jgi:hypothetical protein
MILASGSAVLETQLAGKPKMTVSTMQSVLLWCTVINFGILAFWGLFMLLFSHDWLYRLVGRWYRIPPERFDELNYIGIVSYKILILMFNFVPYIALRIAG